MSDPTPADIEAGARGLYDAAEHRVRTWERYVELCPDGHEFYRAKAAAVVRAVLPAHDARIRAQAGEDIARALIGEETEPHGMISVAEAVEIAREVTGAGEDAP